MPILISKYSCVNTKVRALYGRLLTKDNYKELLEKKSVQSAAEYLKKSTGYGKLLSEINESLVHRGELEKLLKTSLYSDFLKALRFIKGNSGEFLKAAFLRYEIEDLKMLFRIVLTKREDEAIINSLIFLKKYSRLDYKKLICSKSISDILLVLKGSEYHKVLLPLFDDSKQPHLFDIEMSLDLYYFMTILKLKDKLLPEADCKSITETFGDEIDVLNILMIYRCKKLFRLPAELTYKYIIPYWSRLSRDQLIHLTQSQDVDDFKGLILKTKYKHIFRPEEEHRWEINSMNHLYRKYKSHFRTDCLNLGMTMTYLHLKEMDIRNIITLIEGIRYSLPGSEIKDFLIGISM